MIRAAQHHYEQSVLTRRELRGEAVASANGKSSFAANNGQIVAKESIGASDMIAVRIKFACQDTGFCLANRSYGFISEGNACNVGYLSGC